MANAGWKKLKAALGAGFDVPEPVQQMPEMDLTGTMQMPEMDLSHPEDVTKTRPLVKGSRFQVPAEMRMPTMDLSKPERVMEMPAMDLRPGAVDAGETDVSQADLDTKFTESDEQALARLAQVPQTETLVARPGAFGKGELISPDDPTATMPEPVLTSMSTGRVPAGKERVGSGTLLPDRSDTKALLAKARGKPAPGLPPAKPELNPGLSEADINSVGPAEGPALADAFPTAPVEDSPGFAAVRRPLVPRPGSVPAQVGQAITSATPNPQSDLELAQQRARAAEREAQYAAGMGQAADIISGTRYNQNAGEDIRAAGQQGVKDVLDREAQALRAAGEGRAVEDQGFQRSAEQRAAGADTRAAQGFATQQGEFDPNHPRSKGARAALVAQYPKIAARIPPDQFAQMSEHDIKMLMTENPEQQPKGAGKGMGGTGSAKNVVALSKLLPPETANVYAGSQRINQLVQKGGGWGKVGGVGLLGGKMPTWMPQALGGLSDDESALRSEIGNLAATHLQSKGGKAITSAEDKIILGKIAANPNAATAEQLQQGMAIIERNTAGNARQGLAVLPPELRNQILQNAGIPPAWVDQPATVPTRQTADAAGTMTVTNGKETLVIPVEDFEDARRDGFRRVGQ